VQIQKIPKGESMAKIIFEEGDIVRFVNTNDKKEGVGVIFDQNSALVAYLPQLKSSSHEFLVESNFDQKSVFLMSPNEIAKIDYTTRMAINAAMAARLIPKVI
jgi:hypothetical protein